MTTTKGLPPARPKGIARPTVPVRSLHPRRMNDFPILDDPPLLNAPDADALGGPKQAGRLDASKRPALAAHP